MITFAQMNRLTSISLSMIFVVQIFAPNMDMCCELEKLPALFAHFEEHKAFDGDSFFEFLVEDYVHHDDNSEGHHDHDKDDDLPFHGQHQCNHAPIYLTYTFSNIELGNKSFSLQTKGSFYQFSISSEYLDKPIQPPQA